MCKIGSPEWFHKMAQAPNMLQDCKKLEEERQSFIDRFSPDILKSMNGQTLLKDVFSNDPLSMMELLYSKRYKQFGSIGSQKDSRILYMKKDSFRWTYKEKNIKLENISVDKAARNAETLRDQLVYCVEEIDRIGVFKTIEDYKKLETNLNRVFFHKYVWAIKYYQMIYPQYFPAMYAQNTQRRAIKILGLSEHNYNNILNAGEISLFIRRCDVNNIVFNAIYDEEWGWEIEQSPCENAVENKRSSTMPVDIVNREYYKAFSSFKEKKEKEESINRAVQIDDEINALGLVGMEKIAFVKIRVNQNAFRNQLLEKYDKCCICGVRKKETLLASHIKPWVNSQPEEKLDPCNGLLLCPNHDKLFDSGLISFDDSGRIMISNELSKEDRELLNVHSEMTIPISDKNKLYLKYHRDNVFRKEN